MAATDAPGWFGKIAPVGDFVSRRLAPEWVQACDGWLSAGLRASADQLGERWLASYLAAPVWRFAWAPGVVDAQWWFGVLMPSCDKVGRYFPLVVAQARAQAPVDRFALDHLDLWWTHLARAALHTLGEGATVDGFEEALHHAPPWPGAGGATALRALAPRPQGGDDAEPLRERWGVGAHGTLADVMHRLAAEGLKQRLAGHSFWWPLQGLPQASALAGHCTVARGLPPATAFVDLLAGHW